MFGLSLIRSGKGSYQKGAGSKLVASKSQGYDWSGFLSSAGNLVGSFGAQAGSLYLNKERLRAERKHAERMARINSLNQESFRIGQVTAGPLQMSARTKSGESVGQARARRPTMWDLLKWNEMTIPTQTNRGTRQGGNNLSANMATSGGGGTALLVGGGILAAVLLTR